MSAAREHDMGKAGLRGRLLLDEPMSRHVTWRVGGPADRFYVPADAEDLAAYLATLAPDEPVFWLGLGSNLLVRDGGLRGSVIATALALGHMERIDDGLRVEAGVPCARVARAAADAGLEGAEFLVGIPGTMGGALAMNAGAFGGETWSLVTAVETVDRHGVRRLRGSGDYRIGYRSVEGPAGEWFLAAHLGLRSGDGAAARERIRDCLRRRTETQPTGVASCGSVFRNPPGDHAGRLIEAAGLKGYCIGDACVAEKHANFILNRGGARARDIEALIAHVQAVVEQTSGIRLRPEVHIVGEHGEER
ncbi:MAG: UDP-N-acetylmuramate dehydrogenase [Gammaproteobacteria bacterium]|jgi:UDP-N-acetylmuramate dehydrogenase|nr:UDP-N-acetylmuramate dehydrogenase [Gammaproteobacteria bacterium]